MYIVHIFIYLFIFKIETKEIKGSSGLTIHRNVPYRMQKTKSSNWDFCETFNRSEIMQHVMQVPMSRCESQNIHGVIELARSKMMQGDMMHTVSM